MSILAARDFRTRISECLNLWDKNLQRTDDPPRGWIHQEAEEKFRTLVSEYPKLETCRKRLVPLLRRGHYYKASNLITACAFEVRKRNLESQAD